MNGTTQVVREPRDVIDIINRVGVSGAMSKLVIVLALGCTLLDGYDFSALGVGAPQVKAQFHLSSAMFGTTTAAIAIGAFIGALVGGYYVDKIGRIRMLSLDGVFFVVAAAGAAIAMNVYWLIICRFIMGLGVGLDFPVALSFIAEYKGRKGRGAALTGWGVMFSVGVLLTYVVDIIAHASGAGPSTWRIVLGFGAVPGLVVILGRYFWLQESPMWAASRGDLHAAAAILQRSYGLPVQVDAAEKITGREPNPYSLRSYAAVFRRPYLRRTVLSSVIGLTQSVEFFAVSFYLPVLTLKLFGGKFYPAVIGAMLLSAVVPVGTLIALKLVDRQSMRMLISVGYAGVVCALIVLGAGHGYLPLSGVVFFIVVFQFGHGFGPGTLGMTMAGMSYPTRIRGAGVGVSQGLLRVGSIIGFYLFPLLLAATGLGTALLILLFAPVLGLAATLLIRWEPVGRDVDTESAEAVTPASATAVPAEGSL